MHRPNEGQECQWIHFNMSKGPTDTDFYKGELPNPEPLVVQ